MKRFLRESDHLAGLDIVLAARRSQDQHDAVVQPASRPGPLGALLGALGALFGLPRIGRQPEPR